MVFFDKDNSEYWIEDDEGKLFERKRRLPPSIKFEDRSEEDADPITFEGDRVAFYTTGAIEEGSGSVTITDKQGNSKTISIIGSTGKIRVE